VFDIGLALGFGIGLVLLGEGASILVGLKLITHSLSHVNLAASNPLYETSSIVILEVRQRIELPNYVL
jgi:hypothetical protein